MAIGEDEVGRTTQMKGRDRELWRRHGRKKCLEVVKEKGVEEDRQQADYKGRRAGWLGDGKIT